MLAMPSNVVRSRLVQSKAEQRFVLRHLSCHIVPPSQFTGKTASVYNEDKTNNSVKRFCREELGIGINTTSLTNFHRHGTTHHNMQGQVLGIQSVVGQKGSSWLFRKMTPPLGKYLSDGTARTQGLGVAVSVEWPYLPHHQEKEINAVERESVAMVAHVSEYRVHLARSHCVLRQMSLPVLDGGLVGFASGLVLNKSVQDPIRDDVGEQQLHLGNQLFQLESTCGRRH